MYRKSTQHARRFGSHVALALALAGGGVLGSAVIATPALAQKKKEEVKESKPTNSKAFAAAYTPLSAAVTAGTDLQAAKAMVPGVQATIETNHDKYLMGNVMISLGDKLKDVALQEQGIQLMLDSGEVPADKLGQFHYYIGKFALDAKDFPKARAAFERSAAAGFAEGNPEVVIAETYFGEKNYPQGLSYLGGLIEQRKAAGQEVPAAWYQRGLAMAYESKVPELGNEWANRLLSNSTDNDSWLRAFTVVGTLNKVDEQGQLDMLRLMRLTDTLKEKYQYQEYIDTTIRNGLPSETLAVINYGVGKSAFGTSDPVYLSAKEAADPMIARDARDIPGLAKDAQAASTGRNANGAGNAFYSLGRYAEAEAMYKLALEKGAPDADLTRTRLGMAQIQQGKLAEGKATLEQVGGTRAPIADLWVAYANAKSSTGA
ncbi:hypothetical protein [Tsuneonella sp. HG222]